MAASQNSYNDLSNPASGPSPYQPSDQSDAARKDARKAALKAVCQETLSTLPSVLNHLQSYDLACRSHRHTLESLPRLRPDVGRPGFPQQAQRAAVEVVNEDTLNAAIALAGRRPQQKHRSGGIIPSVAVLNFANRHSPGGGWRNGALAQEEALCYRSSLAMSLESADYPLKPHEALYTPYVLIVRHDMGRGHRLIGGPPEDFPAVSVLTVAALFKPEVKTITLGGGILTTSGGKLSGGGTRSRQEFLRDRDRNYTKDKMRLVLRMAATRGHESLVLGALGCGVFENPAEDVAHCWLEVLREHEFSGRPWRDVCFAVYDPKNEGNYEVFSRVLHGKLV